MKLGHIFDTNTLRNLALVDQLNILPQVCSGSLYRSGIVKDELDQGAVNFGRAHLEEMRRGRPQRSVQSARFHQLNSTLKQLSVHDVQLTLNAAHADAFQFFGCCVSVEDMDAGEAESFALAATRGWTFYTDDRPAKQAIDRFNAGNFGCPPYGREPQLHRPVPVHSTAWLLLEAINSQVLTTREAEEAFAQMRDIWDRHPQQTLMQLRARGAAAYW